MTALTLTLIALVGYWSFGQFARIGRTYKGGLAVAVILPLAVASAAMLLALVAALGGH